MAVAISASVIEWYSVKIFLLPISRMLVGFGVMTPVTASVVAGESHFPSLARMRRDTTKEGNVEVSPFQMLSNGAETVAYAVDPERDDKSKGSAEAKGSKTLGGGAAALGMLLIAVTRSPIAAARSTLVAMLLRVLDLSRIRDSRRSRLMER